MVSDSFARPSFTLEQIRTFLVVAAREHVTHAAQVLGLSQPAVTQQVQLLERALGIRLLERIGRNVRLTSAGVEVSGACLLIMRALENLEEVVQAVRGLDRGSVAIGASPLAADYYLARVVTDFAMAHPRISLGVVVGEPEEIFQQVAAGDLECGLIDGEYTVSGSLVRHRVAIADVVLVANAQHPAARHVDRPGQLLNASRLLVWQAGAAIEALSAQLLGEAYEGTPQTLIGSMEAARRALLLPSNFVTVLPHQAVAGDVASEALLQVGEARPLPVFAVRRHGPDSPSLEALWQLMVRRQDRPR